MRSVLVLAAALAAVAAIVIAPGFRLRAQGNSNLAGLKAFQVDCANPAISAPAYDCKGDPVGNAQLSDSVTFGSVLGSDSTGTSCAEDSATDVITTPDGSTINLVSHGMICFEATPGFAVRHNAYLIEGGTGRFQGATGAGNIVVSSENPNGVPLIYIDGNINLPK